MVCVELMRVCVCVPIQSIHSKQQPMMAKAVGGSNSTHATPVVARVARAASTHTPTSLVTPHSPALEKKGSSKKAKVDIPMKLCMNILKKKEPEMRTQYEVYIYMHLCV